MREGSNNSAHSVVVIGAGGNIGSQLVTHLARMPSVAQVTLIDRDAYEPSNLTSQFITPRDIGRSKVTVQARRLRRINPQLLVTAIKADVESLPLGQLRADVILACLDSRRARQYVNQAAWHLGVPWIDAGVDGGGLLARVNIYMPGDDNPCLECAWDERDYAALEQTYPCLGITERNFATSAPSSLGALAASLQAIECEKLLTGQTARAVINQQVLIDAMYHKHFRSTFRRNPDCRFFDHLPWRIEKLDHQAGQLTVRNVLELGRRRTLAAKESLSLRVEGKRFVKRLTCVGCGHTKPLLRLQTSLRASELKCAVCGQILVAAGSHLVERLYADALAQKQLGLTLASIGLRRGEVFSMGNRYCEARFEV